MWPTTKLTKLFGIEHPIIQAPMAGSTTVSLASAVSNAGGMGSIGCAVMSPEEVGSIAAALRGATNQAFNLNFFAHGDPQQDLAVNKATASRLKSYYDELGLGDPPQTVANPYPLFDDAMLDLLVEARPPVVSFHFGLPAGDAVERLKAAGVLVICSATSVAEAVALEGAGCDAVIAQGWEAGGHRGAFLTEPDDVGIGTLSLVPQMVDAVDVPVIAAGGIADGRGVAAAFALGASGVQIGTAFLSCPEANVPELNRQALRDASDTDTRLTLAYTGRPARARNTRYIEEMGNRRDPLPEFPLMRGYSAPLKSAENTDESTDFQILLYGQSASLNREVPAGELVETLANDALSLMKRLAV